MTNLRPYQISAIDSIYKAWDQCNRVLLQMPTGLGKTTVFSEIVKEFVNQRHPNKRVLVLVHRIELLDQVRDRLDQFGIKATAISSNLDFDIDQKVVVATIQTLIKRLDVVTIRSFSLIVVDEAHHSTSSSYLRVFEHYTYESLKILGVTATPRRLDGLGFDEIYDVLIPGGQIRDYIPEYLCDVTQRASSYPDFATIKIDPVTKDYESSIAKSIMSNTKVMADLVDSYKQYCNEKRTIIFAVNTEHSKEIVSRLQQEAVRIQYIDYQTNKTERKRIVNNFKSGALHALCNVDIFTEGFDCPEVDVVILARPTKSLALYLQQAGRCLRPKADGRKGLILDHAKLWLEHGLIKSNRFWSLSGTNPNQELYSTKNGIRKIIDSREIELPVELKNMVMEEFQLEETSKIPPPDTSIQIDMTWWISLENELKDILISSAQIEKNPKREILEDDLQLIWNLETIDLTNRQIKTLLPINKLKKIKRAECCMLGYHSIKSFSNWKHLEYLDLSFSSVTSLNSLEHIESLRYLNISNTQIKSIQPILNNTSLKELNVSNSNVNQIGLVERLPKLEKLSICGYKIKEIDFLRNLSNLKYLNISQTEISSIKYLRNDHSLQTLITHDCQDFNFSSINLEKIKALDCSYSNFKNLKDLTGGGRNVHLELLNISGCKISDLKELPYFDKLKMLILDDIHVKEYLIRECLMMNRNLIIRRNGESLTYENKHLAL